MIIDGLLISVIGIGMVFLIFVILIILMNATSAIVAFLDKKFPVSSPPELKPSAGTRNAGENEDALVAIAIAAVIQNEKEKSVVIKK